MSDPRAAATLGVLVADLAAELRAGVRPALADEPDGVHHLRTVVRRLRGVLSAFDACFVDAAPVRLALAECGARLGARRDAEVRAADAHRAAEVLGLTPTEAADLTAELDAAGRRTQGELVAWAHGPVARGIVTQVSEWAAAPCFTDTADSRASRVLRSVVRRERQRVLDRALQLTRADPAQAHEVRKAGRRLRHVAEVAAPHLAKEQRRAVVVLGRLGRDIQGSLGDHRDALLLAERAEEVGLHRVAAWSQAQAAAALLGLPGALLALAENDTI